MRSKEVDLAIESLKNIIEKEQWCLHYDLDKSEVEDIKTALGYISKLEEENKTQRGQLNSAFDNGFIHKDVIRELKEKTHNLLDNNGITRAYQLAIDKMFDEILGERK